MWVVRDADTTIYLFGTFHALDGKRDWFNDEVKQAFDASDDVVKILKGNMGWHQDSTYMPVQAKGAVFSCEVTPAAGGSDPSSAKGGAGQRVWNLLQF